MSIDTTGTPTNPLLSRLCRSTIGERLRLVSINNLTHEWRDDMDESDDYIPKSDEEFAVWLDNFIAVARELLDELPITAEDLANLEAKRNEWKISCAAHLEAEANAKEADRELTEAGRKLKVAQRESMDGGTLPLVKGVAANPQLQELTRRHAGMTLRKMLRPKEDHTGDEES
jgi:hypothetical protein